MKSRLFSVISSSKIMEKVLFDFAILVALSMGVGYLIISGGKERLVVYEDWSS